jgi:peptidyl-tRNA hydrolase
MSEAYPWPNLFEGRFEGREAFAERVRAALAAAAQEGWQELVMSDANFEDWPLGERALAESLQQWAQGGRRLILLARHYDEVLRRHARFVSWRRTWDHLVQARACRTIEAADFPSLIWSPSWAMQRLDLQRCTGIGSRDPERRVQVRERFDEVFRRSSPGFPASTLGL